MIMNKKMKKLVAKNKKKIITIASIVTIIIVAALVICLYIAPAVNNNIRKDRIISIFNSLKLDDKKYTLTYESIFGDKRIYEWDSSRSYSSERIYIRGANVDTTVAELKQAITKTDFKFYEEPYPGITDFMYIYKSPKNEYLRVSVSSKTRQDDFFNKSSMGLSTKDITTDPNTGPSNVTIKVNLNDNNE
jgi:hypothetical protein